MLSLTATPAPLPRAAGRAVFGVFALFVAIGIVRRALDEPPLAVIGGGLALGFGAAAILGPRRYLVPAAIIATVGVAVLGHGTSSSVAWFGLPVLAAWCALSAPLWVAGGYWVGSLLLLAGEAIFASHDPGWAAWIGGTSFSAVASFLGRRQRDLVAQLRTAQAGLARRAQAEERNRIARELHDVIAHSLVVSLLHVSSARLALDEDPDEAARALDEAERLGRQSLDEVRHAVGLLRRDGESDPRAPLPGSLDMPALVERFRAAGADVPATITGDLAALPSTVGLAAYRILQEALTNAVKHAPNATSLVHVTVERDALRLSVDTSGPPGRGTGLGLVGMRERAESLGGRFSAGPGGSGWLVRAELPL
jgi:signal transduction histidine kinase